MHDPSRNDLKRELLDAVMSWQTWRALDLCVSLRMNPIAILGLLQLMSIVNIL